MKTSPWLAVAFAFGSVGCTVSVETAAGGDESPPPETCTQAAYSCATDAGTFCSPTLPWTLSLVWPTGDESDCRCWVALQDGGAKRDGACILSQPTTAVYVCPNGKLSPECTLDRP